MKKSILVLSFISLQLSFFNIQAQTGKWTQVATNCPNQNMGVTLLLTDGTVICHNTTGGGDGTGWDKLTPDIHGSYVNGTWSTIASMTNDRLFFASQILQNGNVYVAGGEYGAGAYGGEVYNPVTDTWTACGPIPGGWNIYDGNSEILYNGTVLQGVQEGSNWSYDNLIYNPVTNLYTVAPNSIYNHDEAEWVKLPDSTVLFVGINTTSSNRYEPKTNTWINDGTLPVNIWDGLSESGAGFMLPNGKAIFFGATPQNAIYTPTGNTTPGTWAAAASFPNIGGVQMGQSDASAAMMVNGKILCAVAPYYSSFPPPTFFVEYDYKTNSFTQVTQPIPGMGGDSINVASYQTQMLDLPDGTVLLSISQANSLSNQYYIYTPGSAAIPEGKPTINSILPDGCPNYKITGKLFTGISEGAAYGDDWEMSTNFPIIRLTNGTNVYYARTTYWTRLGSVQTDSLEDTAIFTMPVIPAGTYSLVVTVNGFASNPILWTTLGVNATPTNILCNGGVGSATANPFGGISPYTYSWSPGGGTTQSLSNLSIGTYSVTITDNNGCTQTNSVTITQPNTLTAAGNIVSNVSCNGGNNGILTSSVGGGTSPYTYLWTGGSTSSTISGLTIGTYTLNVTDKNGCTATSSVSITQPSALTVVHDSVSQNGPCNGLAAVIPSGGIMPYTYLWATGNQTTDTIKNQCSGTYCCTITDNNGCATTTCVVIDNTTGILNISKSSGVEIFPNPSSGNLYITGLQNGMIIEIYDYRGRNISTQLTNDNSQLTINMFNQSNGIYLIRILDKDGNLVGQKKVVKTN